jgi:cell division protein FtsB
LGGEDLLNRYIRRYREIQKRGERGRYRVLLAACLSLSFLAVITFYSVWSRSFVMEQSGEMERLRQRALELSAEIDGLNRRLGVLTSRSYLVERSTKELHMIFPKQEDLVFVVLDSAHIRLQESR